MATKTHIPTYLSNLSSIVKDVLKEYSDNTPLTNRFFKFKEYLLTEKNTKQIVFNKNKWELKPYLFCMDTYGEEYQYIYPIIMTLNSIKSIHEFKPDNFRDKIIYAPSLETILKVLEKS
jgi:hypothetical protein